MSSLIHGCCAITLLAVCACGPRSGVAPSHPSAQARNGQSEKSEAEKKTRKQRPPLVAPPPAYGNKIVEHEALESPEPAPTIAAGQPTSAVL